MKTIATICLVLLTGCVVQNTLINTQHQAQQEQQAAIRQANIDKWNAQMAAQAEQDKINFARGQQELRDLQARIDAINAR